MYDKSDTQNELYIICMVTLAERILDMVEN